MKKRLFLLPLIAVLLAGCGESSEERPISPTPDDPVEPVDHTHTFEEKWTTNATSHWHAATCGHDVKDSEGEHYDDNHDNRCDVCDYYMAPIEHHVESVSLNKKTLSLNEGTSETLTYTITPSNADNKKVTWESSNAIVASVEDGVVKAWNVGTTNISVITDDGNKTDTCAVTVTKEEPEVPTVTESYNVNEQGYTADEDIDNKTLTLTTNFSAVFNKADGTTTPKIMSYSKEAKDEKYSIRAYAGNTFTISSETIEITKISMVISSKKDDGNVLTTNIGSVTNDEWTGKSKSVTFSVASNKVDVMSGCRAIQQIIISYEGQGEDDPDVVINLGEKTISEVKQYITDHPVKKNAYGNGVNEKCYVTISGYVLARIDTVKTTSTFGLDCTYAAKVIMGDETGIMAVATTTAQNTLWMKAKDYVCQQTTKYKVTGYISEILGNPELKIISYQWDQTMDIDWSLDTWKDETVSLEQFYERACDTNYNCGGSAYGKVYEIKGLYCYNFESGGQGVRFYNFTDGTLNLRVNSYNMATSVSIGGVYDITGILSMKDYSPIIVPFDIKTNGSAGTTFNYESIAVKISFTELNKIHRPQKDTSEKQPDAIKAFSKIYCVEDYTQDPAADTIIVDNADRFYEYGYNYPPTIYFAMKQFNFSGGGEGYWQITLVPDCVIKYNEK